MRSKIPLVLLPILIFSTYAKLDLSTSPLVRTTLFTGAAIAGTLASQAYTTPELHWDWKMINTDKISFPPGFLFGAATSAYQVEGNCHNSWSEWEKMKDKHGKSRVEEPSGKACNHWDRYKEDIQLLKTAGLNTYRFSVEWSKIEPKEGVFNEETLQHYVAVCQELIRNDIRPVITLHHYTDPLWFMEKGGFEKKQNIQFFVDFCVKVFEYLHPYVHLWLTFNTPSGYAAKGYLEEMAPPGKRNMQLMAEVFKNLLEAHVQVYQALKNRPGGKQSRIGILKNIFQFDPWRTYNPLDLLACKLANNITNKGFFSFFTTGIFTISIPFKIRVRHTNVHACKSLDFIGLNYYSHTYFNNFVMMRHPDEIPADEPRYTLYAEGLYRALKELSSKVAQPLGIPIYITENGIATENEHVRELFFKRYLYALSKAIHDGCNVQGYICWALMDNYEWGILFKRKYGIYPIEPESLERGKIRKGAEYYSSVAKRFGKKD